MSRLGSSWSIYSFNMEAPRWASSVSQRFNYIEDYNGPLRNPKINSEGEPYVRVAHHIKPTEKTTENFQLASSNFVNQVESIVSGKFNKISWGVKPVAYLTPTGFVVMTCTLTAK